MLWISWMHLEGCCFNKQLSLNAKLQFLLVITPMIFFYWLIHVDNYSKSKDTKCHFPAPSLSFSFNSNLQILKQPSRGVPRKRCSKNMQDIYRRTPMPKCDFNKVAKQLYWNHSSAWVFSPVNFLHIFRTPFTKNNSG